MKWFKKKEKKVEENTAPDFSKYRIKINGKVMCAYEAMTGRSFLKIETEEDILKLFYCSFVLNNEDFSTLEYSTFEYLIRDTSVLEWMAREYEKISSFLRQFNSNVGDSEDDIEEGKKEEDKTFYMLEAISGLIVRMGIDPHYVMYDMDEWEIAYYYRMMRDMDRDRLTEERLWTYFQVLPHVGKKLGTPEKMLPFPWEKNNKKKEKELENNTKAAVAFFKKQYNNGEQGLHDSVGQERFGNSECLAESDGEGRPVKHDTECIETGSINDTNSGKDKPRIKE